MQNCKWINIYTHYVLWFYSLSLCFMRQAGNTCFSRHPFLVPQSIQALFCHKYVCQRSNFEPHVWYVAWAMTVGYSFRVRVQPSHHQRSSRWYRCERGVRRSHVCARKKWPSRSVSHRRQTAGVLLAACERQLWMADYLSNEQVWKCVHVQHAPSLLLYDNIAGVLYLRCDNVNHGESSSILRRKPLFTVGRSVWRVIMDTHACATCLGLFSSMLLLSSFLHGTWRRYCGERTTKFTATPVPCRRQVRFASHVKEKWRCSNAENREEQTFRHRKTST